MGQDGGVKLWSAPSVAGPVTARVPLPGSKSITNRALVLAALADGPSTIRGTLRSRDTDLMIDALRTLGVSVDGDGTEVRIAPAPLRAGSVECGLAGTVMRFLPALAPLADGPVHFDGDPQARVRPVGPVLGALRDLGVTVDGDALPVTVHGTGALDGGEVVIDSSGSSQFVSALLLVGARTRGGLTVRHRGASVPSMPHVDMTVDMLATVGVIVSVAHGPGEEISWTVPETKIAAHDWAIEPDLSNATPFLAAAAVTGGQVRVPHWPERTTQGGDAIRQILTAMGAEAELVDGELVVRGPQTLRGIDIDLSATGELAPTVAAMAALAEGRSHLRGIAHLRGHETDRLAALTTEINRLGGRAAETEDGIVITPAPLTGGRWGSYADHRMATAGAIIGLKVPGVEVEDIETTGKTMPDFPAMWAAMIGADS